MRFGAMLRQARGNLKQTEVDERAGVPHGNLSLMERGHRYPNAETLRRLCAALPLDFDEAWKQIGREKSGGGGGDADGGIAAD